MEQLVERVIVQTTDNKIIRLPKDCFATLDYQDYDDDEPNFATIYLHVEGNRTKVVCETADEFKENWERLKCAVYGKRLKDSDE